MKMALKEIGWEAMNCIDLAWRAGGKLLWTW